jgi:hypothetical protein
MEKALREISAKLLGGCAWSCTGRKVDLDVERILTLHYLEAREAQATAMT